MYPDFKDTQLKPDILQYTIQNLLSGKFYQVRVMAVNNKGPSLPLNKIIKTKEGKKFCLSTVDSTEEQIRCIFDDNLKDNFR